MNLLVYQWKLFNNQLELEFDRSVKLILINKLNWTDYQWKSCDGK